MLYQLSYASNNHSQPKWDKINKLAQTAIRVQ